MSHSISSFVTAAQVNTIISKVDTVDTVVDAVKAKTDIIGASVALETGGNIAAIKTKTDATPQNVRGNWNLATLITANGAFQIVVDITGHGKLFNLTFYCSNGGDTNELRLTVDGTAWELITHTGNNTHQVIFPEAQVCVSTSGKLTKAAMPITMPCLFNLEFGTSLKVEIRRSAGAATVVGCSVHYSLDGF